MSKGNDKIMSKDQVIYYIPLTVYINYTVL